jgi:hypothetical protein
MVLQAGSECRSVLFVSVHDGLSAEESSRSEHNSGETVL